MEKRKYKAWNTQEEQALTRLRAEGLSFGKIGIKLGRSSGSCAAHARDMRKRAEKRLASEGKP